jgi:hypothetical protein
MRLDIFPTLSLRPALDLSSRVRKVTVRWYANSLTTLTAVAIISVSLCFPRLPRVAGGVGSTLGWAVIWPFETLKNQIQANAAGPNTIFKRLVWVAREQGVSGLYRGFLPGGSRSLIANGASMLMFEWCQGLRAPGMAPVSATK